MYSYGAGAYAGYPNYQQQPVAQQPQQQQVSFFGYLIVSPLYSVPICQLANLYWVSCK